MGFARLANRKPRTTAAIRKSRCAGSFAIMPTTQTALLIMAHGSRASAANEEFLAFVNKLAEQNQHYTAVRGVFLELSEPSLVQAVHSLADQGINTFQLYPLFFNCGKHVQKDIPLT